MTTPDSEDPTTERLPAPVQQQRPVLHRRRRRPLKVAPQAPPLWLHRPDVVRVTYSEGVRQLVLLAEANLYTGRPAEARRMCTAAWAAVQRLAAPRPDLVATVLAVDAHVSVATRAPTAVHACRRYHSAAVDDYVAGQRRRLFYAQALNATLLASANPGAAADAFQRLLRQPRLTADDTAVAERALAAARTSNRGAAAGPQTPPPPLPGGAWLALTGSPDPDCLAWLILNQTSRLPASSGRAAMIARRPA